MLRSGEPGRKRLKIIRLIRVVAIVWEAPKRRPDCQGRTLGLRHAAVWCKLGTKMRGSSRRSMSRAGRVTRGACVVLALALAGCGTGETFQRGYVLPDGALEQIPLGASQEQALLVLGTPSTVATVSGEAFYYISQKAQRPISFVDTTITDQRVIVVYFDKNRKVQRLAEYGMKDGKIFDFISRTTPTTGAENNFLTYMFRTIKGQGS